MNLKKILYIFSLIIFLASCADFKINKSKKKQEKKYYLSNGFALIYDNNLFKQKIINKKINNENIVVMHSTLPVNTPVKIINPINSKFVETKVYKRADYPKIFNVVISKRIASILKLDKNDPYVEVSEMKKNKKFIAKEGNTFDEERNVAEKAPVDEIEMNDLSKDKSEKKTNINVNNIFVIVISDFYYKESAYELMEELSEKTTINNLSVKKINNNKYRLLSGPFKNFNALKTTYISLNNLGFEDLNIYKN